MHCWALNHLPCEGDLLPLRKRTQESQLSSFTRQEKTPVSSNSTISSNKTFLRNNDLEEFYEFYSSQ